MIVIRLHPRRPPQVRHEDIPRHHTVLVEAVYGTLSRRTALRLYEVIVYSGSILFIVVRVTGHRVTFSLLITSHHSMCARETEMERP